MIVIGLTGATGAGKGCFSHIASEKFGFVHIDTDKTARYIVEPGKPCLDEIKEFFGDTVINSDGTLNRRALGDIVFSDSEKLAVLNKLTHHYVTNEVKKILEKSEMCGETAVVIDAPLLFESGEQRLCDVTVGIIADKIVRRKRIMARDGISAEAAEKRIASGKDENFFRERCDYVLENNSDECGFEKNAIRLIEIILEKYR